jgi:hypothetical protein
MQATVGARPPVDFQSTSGVEFARIDQATGLLAGDQRPGDPDPPFVPFLTGTAPTELAGDRRSDGPKNFFLDDK